MMMTLLYLLLPDAFLPFFGIYTKCFLLQLRNHGKVGSYLQLSYMRSWMHSLFSSFKLIAKNKHHDVPAMVVIQRNTWSKFWSYFDLFSLTV